MTRALARHRLFVPLVRLAAVVLLFEEWCWDAGMRLTRACARWPLLAALETRVRALPPYAALCAFALPGLLLFPVKVLALVAIAHGHPASGITTLVVAKLGGAAVVARLYALTLPTLLAVGWFARCHGWFMRIKDRYVAQLRASRAYHAAGHALRGLKLGLKLGLRRAWRRRRAHAPGAAAPSGQGGYAVRLLRRFIARWRARRR